MCGIFGFITKEGAGPDLGHLAAIAADTETRGVDAFGLAWQSAGGKRHEFKRPGAATKVAGDVKRCGGAHIVIGHCRHATHGLPEVNSNNHPHPVWARQAAFPSLGALVHNGVVRNYKRLADAFDLEMKTECDSEVIGLLVGQQSGTMLQQFKRAVALVEGPCALLALFKNSLVMVRRGNPLWFSVDPEGYYFASRPNALRVPVSLPDSYLGVCRIKDGKFV